MKNDASRSTAKEKVNCGVNLYIVKSKVVLEIKVVIAKIRKAKLESRISQ